MTQADPELFDRRPWRRVADEDFGAAAAVPTMLSKPERKLYLWLAEYWAEGDGAIVDLGCFAGGSTAYLAEGVRRSARKQAVHAYDKFRASAGIKTRFLYPRGVEPFDGDDIEPLARQLLSPWSKIINLHPGRIEQKTWDGGTIELLVVDAAKSVAVLDRIADTFYRHLIPGQSLIVHQDILHWKVPWIAYQMQQMQDCFEPVGHCAPDTLIFRCRTAPDDRALARGRATGVGDLDLMAAISEAQLTWGRWKIDAKLNKLQAGLAANPMARRAKDMIEKPAG